VAPIGASVASFRNMSTYLLDSRGSYRASRSACDASLP
jgi:hypothetical protein